MPAPAAAFTRSSCSTKSKACRKESTAAVYASFDRTKGFAERRTQLLAALKDVRRPADLVARGIPRDRVVVTGVPVRAAFATASDPREARRELGVPDDVPMVLAMAGSHGSVGRLPDVARALVRAPRPLAGMLVAGHDHTLRATLERLAAGTSLRVLGFVPDVHRLMAAADIVVTKAGGMTLAVAGYWIGQAIARWLAIWPIGRFMKQF